MFNESTLELAIMDLLVENEYAHYVGDEIHKEKT